MLLEVLYSVEMPVMSSIRKECVDLMLRVLDSHVEYIQHDKRCGVLHLNSSMNSSAQRLKQNIKEYEEELNHVGKSIYFSYEITTILPDSMQKKNQYCV